MKYIFEERKIYGGYTLDIHLEDVPTLKGSVTALELAISDLISDDDSIKEIDKVLEGKRDRIESGSNMFWYTITPTESSFEYSLENKGWNFTISTKVLRELTMIWNKRAKEFCKKYKIH